MRYRGFGLEISSDFAIPGALARDGGATGPDLVIERSSASLGADAVESAPYRVHDGKLELTVPGVARYLLLNESQLLVDPEPSAEESDVSALLVASGIPMALWARGGILLHASGVIPAGSDRAVAIAGPRGSGKSTLANVMVAEGGRLLGDDSLWIVERNGVLFVTGLPGGIFAPNIAGNPRAFWPTEPAAQADRSLLGAIVVLDPARSETSLTQLRGSEAMAALLRHRHRPNVPSLLKLEQQRFGLIALLCAQVPVYALGGQPGPNSSVFAQIRDLVKAQ